MADLVVSLIVDIIMFILSFVAVGCSGLVFYISIFKNGIKGADAIPILIMCMLDSIMGLSWILFDIAKWITNYAIMDRDNIGCKIQAVISLGALEASIDCATILAMLRFVVIVLECRINKMFWKAFAITMASLSLLLAILSGVYDLGEVMPTNSYCEPITLKKIPFSAFYSKWLLVRILLLPAIIVFCYSAIAVKYATLMRRLKASNLGYYADETELEPTSSGTKFSQLNSKTYSRPVRSIKRSIVALIIGTFAYVLVFAPSYITNVVQEITQNDNRDVWVDAVTIVSIMSIILINPIFALLVHDETKDEMYKIFGEWRSDSNRILSHVNLS